MNAGIIVKITHLLLDVEYIGYLYFSDGMLPFYGGSYIQTFIY